MLQELEIALAQVLLAVIQLKKYLNEIRQIIYQKKLLKKYITI